MGVVVDRIGRDGRSGFGRSITSLLIIGSFYMTRVEQQETNEVCTVTTGNAHGF